MSAAVTAPRSRAGALLRRGRTPRARQIVGSLWTSVGIQAFLFGSGIVVARSLGPAGRGDIALILILPAVAAQVVCAGVPSAATYFIARNQVSWRAIAGHVPRVAGVQAAVAVGLLLVLDLAFLGDRGQDTRTAALLVLATIPLLISQYYALAILQGLGDLRWWNAFRAAPPACYTIGLFAALAFGLTVFTCACIWLAVQLLVTALVLRHVLGHRHRGRQSATDSGETPSRRELVRFGVVGFLAQVSPVETFYIDTLMVAALFPPQVVGYYAVAFSMSNAPRFVADGIVSVAYPHVSAQERALGQASTRRYLMVAALLCGGVALAVGLALPWLIPALFGDRFEPSVSVGAILVAAVGIVSVRRVGSDCLRALGRPGASTVIELATLALLGIAFLGIAHRGAGKGVALALALSAAAGLCLMLAYLRRIRTRGA